MKKILHILLLVIVCLSWVGCSSDPIVQPSIEIKGSTSYIIGTLGEEISIEFTSAKEWTAQTDQSWCTLSQKYGTGGTVALTITVMENTTTDDREATLTITSETVSKEITITQKQKDALVVAKKEYALGADAASLELELSMNVNALKVDVNVGWIHIVGSSSRAMETHHIAVQIDENLSPNTREGIIVIALENATEDEHQKIKIVQEGLLIKGTVSIVHSNWEMMVPVLMGPNLSGIVNWGDGEKDDYKSDLVHPYAEGKEYTLVLDHAGAQSVKIPSLEGVIEIDLSNF